MSSTDSESFVRAFSRGLDVIEALGVGAHSKSISEVAELTGLPRSAARRLLMTLVERRFVSTDGRTFALSPRVLNLGLSYLQTLPFWRYAQPALEDLRTTVEESCALAVLDDTDIVYVLRVPSRRILAMSLNIGSRLPAHNVSLGQVLLADLDEGALDRYCERADFRMRTSRSIGSPAALRDALARVRARGYAWVDGELDAAICGLAVPLRDRAGRTIAALNTSLISGTWTEAEARRRLLVPLRHAAEQIRTALPA